jgi:hypothetical protein
MAGPECRGRRALGRGGADHHIGLGSADLGLLGAGGGQGLSPARWRRAAHLHLELEEAVRERGLHVGHQVHEHLERLALVLDERVLLTPRAVLDAVTQVVELEQVVLPLLVEHADHHV